MLNIGYNSKLREKETVIKLPKAGVTKRYMHEQKVPCHVKWDYRIFKSRNIKGTEQQSNHKSKKGYRNRGENFTDLTLHPNVLAKTMTW